MKSSRLVCLLASLFLLLSAGAASADDPIRQPLDVQYVSSADRSKQHATFYAPDTAAAVPLVVALHTWSGNYRQRYHSAIEQWCVTKGWAYIHPDFRGPNVRPEATGSELVVGDIASAVEYARKNARIDGSAVYLVGTSGGGYTALLMAGRRPKLWAGVSAWVPISDLRAWYAECKRAGRGYSKHIADSCGGPPDAGREVDDEYAMRSPLTHLKNAEGLHLHINAGINDGHGQGSVPISHSLLAFNEVAAPQDRFSAADISYFVEKAAVPPALKADISDASFGSKLPLFRRSSGKATVTIFQGGHELVASAAIAWIEGLYNQRSEESENGP